MTSRVITTERDLDQWCALLKSRKLPMTVSAKDGADRSLAQNRLQRKWCLEAAEQLADETAEEKRAYCKLHFGIPILRNESDAFADQYDRIVRPLAYEHKLSMMALPLDYPVTRLMTTKQKTEYLNAMWHHFTDQGVSLTEPADKRYGPKMGRRA